MRIACHTDQFSSELQAALKSAGYTCVLFSQEDELVAALRNHRFDLVLADLKVFDRQRDLNGVQLLQEAGFTFDRKRHKAYDRGALIDLTPREFDLAWLFFSSPGTFHSYEGLSAAIWGVDSSIAKRTVEQHIYTVRKKLNLSRERGAWIFTRYTKGYKLEVECNSQPEALAA